MDFHYKFIVTVDVMCDVMQYAIYEWEDVLIAQAHMDIGQWSIWKLKIPTVGYAVAFDMINSMQTKSINFMHDKFNLTFERRTVSTSSTYWMCKSRQWIERSQHMSAPPPLLASGHHHHHYVQISRKSGKIVYVAFDLIIDCGLFYAYISFVLM